MYTALQGEAAQFKVIYRHIYVYIKDPYPFDLVENRYILRSAHFIQVYKADAKSCCWLYHIFPSGRRSVRPHVETCVPTEDFPRKLLSGVLVKLVDTWSLVKWGKQEHFLNNVTNIYVVVVVVFAGVGTFVTMTTWKLQKCFALQIFPFFFLTFTIL
jgi:hypothetical protein